MVNEYGDTGQNALIFIVPLVGGFLAVLLVSGLHLFLPLTVAIWIAVVLVIGSVSAYLWRRLNVTGKLLTRYARNSHHVSLDHSARLWPIRLAVPLGEEAQWPVDAGVRRLYVGRSDGAVRLWSFRPGKITEVAAVPGEQIARVRSFDLDPDGSGRGRRQGIRVDFTDGTWRLLQLRRQRLANELVRDLPTPRSTQSGRPPEADG